MSLSNRPALEETKLPLLECCLFRDIIKKVCLCVCVPDAGSSKLETAGHHPLQNLPLLGVEARKSLGFNLARSIRTG